MILRTMRNKRGESYEKGKTNEAIHVKIPECSKPILAGVFDVFDPACHHSRDK